MDGASSAELKPSSSSAQESRKQNQMQDGLGRRLPLSPEIETERSMQRSRKLLLTTLVVGATSAVAGLGVFAAFTATVSNTGDSIASGTVTISDNDASTALYALTNQGPGASTQRCIHVTYTGSLPATVHLYRTGTLTNGTAFNLQIERGSGVTGAFPSCTGFTSAATIYTGTLAGLGTNFATGVDAKGSSWAQNDGVDYRVTISVVDDPTPNAHATVVSSGTHAFTWEAQNN
jgi:hypothetical protein